MPELPEVEITKRSLSKQILLKKVKSVTIINPKLRYNLTSERLNDLKNKIIIRIKRRSKYILIYFNKKHRGALISTLLGLSSLLGNFLNFLICTIAFNKKRNIYKMRLSGIFNALIGRQSWFRPKIN